MVPNAKSIGFLVNPNDPNADVETADALKAARLLGREIQVINASSDRDIDAAFSILAQTRVGAIIVSTDAFFVNRRDQLVALAATPMPYPRYMRSLSS